MKMRFELIKIALLGIFLLLLIGGTSYLKTINWEDSPKSNMMINHSLLNETIRTIVSLEYIINEE